MRRQKLTLVLELHRAVHQIALRLGPLEGSGVTHAEAIVLAFLHERASATMFEIHKAFGHKRSTLTSVADRLIARGLATRDVSPSDRRSFVITLSRKGMTTARKIHRRLFEMETNALKSVSDRDVATFGDVISRLGNR
jgi:DNA-binding MarR family transcriptional regulator